MTADPFALPEHAGVANVMVNPCATLDKSSPTRLAHDSVNVTHDRCSQVCIPTSLTLIGKLHGLQYGRSCQQLGFTDEMEEESGRNHGIAFFNFARP